jgi:flavodoxin
MIDIGIFVGSVYGNAQQVAEQAQQMLIEHGLQVQVFDDPSLDDFKQSQAIVFISSTTGQGDVPPNLEFFIDELRSSFPLMDNKPFAVAGLGDSSYGDTYCGAGRQIYALLEELQGNPLADFLEVDACETLEPETVVLPWLTQLIPQLTAK